MSILGARSFKTTETQASNLSTICLSCSNFDLPATGAIKGVNIFTPSGKYVNSICDEGKLLSITEVDTDCEDDGVESAMLGSIESCREGRFCPASDIETCRDAVALEALLGFRSPRWILSMASFSKLTSESASDRGR